jgi:hypothetical protein
MPAPKGNQFWKARASNGRKKIFSSPESLWESACEYFQWVDDNPLEKAIIYQGEVTGKESLMRAMTLSGLCIFLDVNTNYFTDFKDRLDNSDDERKEDFTRVINNIYEVIKTQKFEGASAGLLNSNIIARDLGLTDKKQVDGDVLNPLTDVIREISGNTLGPSTSD